MLPAKTPRSIMSIRTKLLTVAVALLLAGHASERLTLRIGDQKGNMRPAGGRRRPARPALRHSLG
jgi:hypothetical protein